MIRARDTDKVCGHRGRLAVIYLMQRMQAGTFMTGKLRFRLEYGDRLTVCFLAGIAAGTAAVNLSGVSLQEEAGYIGQLYEAAARMERAGGAGFLAAVFRQRGLETAFLWFVSMTVFSEKGFCLAALWAGFSSCAVLSVMVCQKGIFGLFCYLAAVWPQYLFYIPAWLLAAAAGARYRNRFPLRSAVLSAALLAAGIGCEAFINPLFVQGTNFL